MSEMDARSAIGDEQSPVSQKKAWMPPELSQPSISITEIKLPFNTEATLMAS